MKQVMSKEFAGGLQPNIKFMYHPPKKQVLIKKIFGVDDYYIDLHGNVYSNVKMPNSERGRGFKTLSPHKKNGYLAVSLSVSGAQRSFYIHNLLLETFVCKRPTGKECRHLDGDRLNINLSNLAWGTRSENQIDRRAHGTDNGGERHPNAKYSDKYAAMVGKMVREMPHKEVARILCIPKSSVSSLAGRARRQFIPPPKKVEP